MESQAFKLFLAFLAVMAVGFGIVATTKETPQEKMQGAFLQTSSLLSNLALDKCTAAVKQEVGAQPYTPSESNSDHMTYVHLTWSNVGSAKHAECRYIMDQGITLLKIDDRTVIEKTLSQTSTGEKPKGEHH
ncbi:hypothetical protein [Methyloterricola oryzae]|uniref:hypothetical protein n=1 Tax=Methyloterricola oryzae TaxID=1495050 RepID=UPI00069994AF|nr:hypothetical protein [Methyloterricola oryzae]